MPTVLVAKVRPDVAEAYFGLLWGGISHRFASVAAELTVTP